MDHPPFQMTNGQVTNGQVTNGKVTIREVARQAGVSISSVSRALSDHPHVSDALRRRVETAAQALGYQPDFLAQRLRQGDTHSVGFLVGAISNPIMADIFTSSSNYLAHHGYAMILACSQNQLAADLAYLHFFAQRQVSGLILSTATDGHEQSSELLEQLKIPTVMLDRQRGNHAHVSAVHSDHSSGTKQAVLHLLAQGHRRIALIGGAVDFHPAAQRLAGYQQAFVEAGQSIDPALMRSVGMNRSVGYQEIHHLLALADPPTALIAGGNLILTGVLQALQERAIRISRDLALVGCDDTDLTRLHTPAISVVARDLAQIGESAAQLLLKLLAGQSGETIILPTQLLKRASSHSAPNGMPDATHRPLLEIP